MLISYHIKAELCTLFDKVHKAFINSANAPSLCTFYRLPTVCLSADTAVRRWKRKTPCLRARRVAAFGGRECRRLAAETKGDRTPMVSCPLLTPQTFLCADTSEMCSETGGIRGHDSGRLSAYGTLYCPEFTLRKPPRITVRGQTVQSASAVAAKSSASIKGVLLEQQTPLWASRF